MEDLIMEKKKIICPNCNLQIEESSSTCPFCGAAINKEEIKKHEEEVKEHTQAKKKAPLHALLYRVGLFVSLALFLAMLLPGESNIFSMIYVWAFVGTTATVTVQGQQFVIGSNAATIVFVFAIVAVLNQIAVVWSTRKKSTEIALFSYFSAFFFILVALISFLSSTLMSMKTAGIDPTQFKFGVGFAVVAVISLACAAIDIVGVIKYKAFLKSNPLETFKKE